MRKSNRPGTIDLSYQFLADQHLCIQSISILGSSHHESEGRSKGRRQVGQGHWRQRSHKLAYGILPEHQSAIQDAKGAHPVRHSLIMQRHPRGSQTALPV